MKAKILTSGLLALLTGCSFMVKTPNVANYSNLDLIDQSTTQNKVALLLGSPQGDGVYGKADALNPMDFYAGFAGEIGTGGADYDFGLAFISYKKEKPVDVIYFTSRVTGKPFVKNENMSIKLVADSLQLGQSKFDDIVAKIGQPQYKGRRINFPASISNKTGYWDSSQLTQNGAIKEKWMMVGYDNNQNVQDFIWVSSYPSDISEFGEVGEVQLKQMSRLVVAGVLPMLEPTGMNSGTKIDPIQVDALIKSHPKKIQDVIDVLGLPSALGIKSFQGSETVLLSNWSFSSVELKGRETNYIPLGASEELQKKLEGQSYMVMNIQQSRLMVGHDRNGSIKEILWTKPIK